MNSPRLLVRNARIVDFAPMPPSALFQAPGDGPARPPSSPGESEPTDLLIESGRVAAVGQGLAADGAETLDAGGAWAIPGLWDAHVHLDFDSTRRVGPDLQETPTIESALAIVADAVAEARRTGAKAVRGFGHRLSAWDTPATVEALDAVTGDLPVVLVAGDGHNGWLNSAAIRFFGLTPRGGPFVDDDWFPGMDLLPTLPGSHEAEEYGRSLVLQQCVSRGITGIVDMSFVSNAHTWSSRPVPPIRVRLSTYPRGLEERVALGLRTGDPLPRTAGARGTAFLTQGPLKVIVDGSLGSLSAWCHEPYPAGAGAPSPHGLVNVPVAELTEMVAVATRAGIEVALHCIGDAAVDAVLDVVSTTGARGRLEHLQLLGAGQAERAAALGLAASVQPLHLGQDRDATARLWPGREERAYAFRSILAAGVPLHLGSDAPVAEIDPWGAMAMAVHRSGDGRGPWTPAERLTPEQALAASVDGAGPVRAGSLGDVVLLDRDPLAVSFDVDADDGERSAAASKHLRAVRVEATIRAGETVFRA